MNSLDSLQVNLPLCRQFGFSHLKRTDRLLLMGLNDADRPIISRIYTELLEPYHQQVLSEFYDFIMGFASMRRFIKNKATLEKLKQTQAYYVLSLGNKFESAEYFEYRLRIGIAHERIGMPLSIYLAAYRKMLELLIAKIPDGIKQQTELYQMYINSLTKLIMLDMSLAIETYSFAHDKELTKSIGELVDQRDTLTMQLMHDTLTGVFTRQFILGVLENSLAQLKRQPDKIIVVAMFDLDHFKHINDTYGHVIGDEVLKEFANILQSSLRDQDYFGRYGGEEFLLLLPDTQLEQALQLTERLRNKVENSLISSENHQITITTSIGLTTANSGENPEQVIQRADRALYIAKDSGRNKVVRL